MRFEFYKRSQLVIRSHNETLSIVAVRVCNPHCSPVGIIEVMADERWARLAEQQGVAYGWQACCNRTGPEFRNFSTSQTSRRWRVALALFAASLSGAS